MSDLDGGIRAPRKRGFEFFFIFVGLNGIFLNRNVFDSCIKNWTKKCKLQSYNGRLIGNHVWPIEWLDYQ